MPSYLPSNYRELAQEHNQPQTQYGHARITRADDLLHLILLHLGADMPLRRWRSSRKVDADAFACGRRS